MPHLRVAAAASATAAAHAALQKPQKCSTGDRLRAMLVFLPLALKGNFWYALWQVGTAAEYRGHGTLLRPESPLGVGLIHSTRSTHRRLYRAM